MANGVITKPSLIKFFQHLRTQLIETFQRVTTDFMDERRKVGAEDAEGYKSAVSKYMAMQNQINDIALQQVFEHFKISEADIGKSIVQLKDDQEVAIAM
jgi:hypothetical protein